MGEERTHAPPLNIQHAVTHSTLIHPTPPPPLQMQAQPKRMDSAWRVAAVGMLSFVIGVGAQLPGGMGTLPPLAPGATHPPTTPGGMGPGMGSAPTIVGNPLGPTPPPTNCTDIAARGLPLPPDCTTESVDLNEWVDVLNSSFACPDTRFVSRNDSGMDVSNCSEPYFPGAKPSRIGWSNTSSSVRPLLRPLSAPSPSLLPLFSLPAPSAVLVRP